MEPHPSGDVLVRQVKRPASWGPIGVFKMRKMLVLAVLAAALTTTACNTVKGAGKDVSAAGDAVSTTAEKAKPN